MSGTKLPPNAEATAIDNSDVASEKVRIRLKTTRFQHECLPEESQVEEQMKKIAERVQIKTSANQVFMPPR